VLDSEIFTWYQRDCRSRRTEDTGRRNLRICNNADAAPRDSIAPELKRQEEE